jgi:hypothetical protein
MKTFINKLISSLDTHTKGFSARKLTAFIIVACCVAAHIKWLSMGDLTMLGEILIIDYSFVAACLGMTTFEAIKTKQKQNEQTV